MIRITLEELHQRWNEFQPRIQSGELQVQVEASSIKPMELKSFEVEDISNRKRRIKVEFSGGALAINMAVKDVKKGDTEGQYMIFDGTLDMPYPGSTSVIIQAAD